MDSELKDIWIRLSTGEIDINNQDIFLSSVLKGLLYKLNNSITIRDKNVQHIIMNTGDDIMYLENKGQDYSIEPLEISNENYIYKSIPVCILTPDGLSIQSDQLTSPYCSGRFQIDIEDVVYDFNAEFRRIPLVIKVNLKYYFDNFTDSMNATQQIITKYSFINNFTVVYLGQTILCSYSIPFDYKTDYNVEFDGLSTDSKYRTIEMPLEINTNIPIVYSNTLIPADAFIRTMTNYNELYPKDSLSTERPTDIIEHNI